MKKMKNGTRFTDYYTATHWLNGNLILCNKICKIDKDIFSEMRFDDFYIDEDGKEQQIDIYQWFLTSYSIGDVKFLERSFGLKFTYSNKLDLFVLCVDNFGTPWTGVNCKVFNDEISDEIIESAEKNR